MNPTKPIEDKSKENKFKSECSVFWDVFSDNLPKTAERSALGDEKMYVAFEQTMRAIKDHYVSKEEVEAMVKELVGKEKGDFKKFSYDHGFMEKRQEIINTLKSHGFGEKI